MGGLLMRPQLEVYGLLLVHGIDQIRPPQISRLGCARSEHQGRGGTGAAYSFPLLTQGYLLARGGGRFLFLASPPSDGSPSRLLIHM